MAIMYTNSVHSILNCCLLYTLFPAFEVMLLSTWLLVLVGTGSKDDLEMLTGTLEMVQHCPGVIQHRAGTRASRSFGKAF